MNKVLLGEARFYFAQCVFNTSCQYAGHDRYAQKRTLQKKIAIIISSLTIISIVLTIAGFESCQSLLEFGSMLGLIATAASLIFEIYNKDDLSEIMLYHKLAAEDYKKLRDKFMDIIRRIKGGDDLHSVECDMKQCLSDYGVLGQYSLPTSYEDYNKAQKALGLKGEGEAFTWNPDEIDRFLPIELREK